MTDQITLNADLRERTGSNKARVIAKEKIKDFEKIIKKPSFITSTLDKKSVSDIKSKLLNYVP